MGERDGQQARAVVADEATLLPGKQQLPAVKPTSSAQANHMVASLIGQRLTPPTKAEQDFGERVVGSGNNVERIPTPWNLADSPATALFSVSGEGFELTSSPVMTLKPSNQMRGDELMYLDRMAAAVAFRPHRAGEFHGALKIQVSWPMDGVVETQVIALRGRARELTQAPVDFVPGSDSERAPGVVETPEVQQDEESRNDDADGDRVVTRKDLRNKDDVEAGINNAASEARKLARSQKEGVKIVEEEAAAYGKTIPKASRSQWWDLAEMALNLATGGLAGVFASKLLPRLLSTTVIDDTGIPGVGRITTTITPKLSEGVTGAVKSAITMAGQKAIKAALPSENATDAGPATKNAAPSGKHSSNARIDFFSEQRRVLDEQEDAYEENVKLHAKVLRPLALDQPKQAIQALSVVAQEFVQLKGVAEQEQANATAPAWTTLVARLKLGQDVVMSARNTPRQATRMDELRETEKGDPAQASAGVLDVYVSSGRVVSARLHGVSQEIADRLANMPLARTPMPIRFILGRPGEPQPTILTRDETGRVRVQGDLNGQRYEPEAARTASEMIERVLTAPLASNGIVIKTDDSTGRGP